MTDEKHRGERQNTPRGGHSRKDRLRLKLRENLKRRKAQARERGKIVAPSSDDQQACPDGQVGKRDE